MDFNVIYRCFFSRIASRWTVLLIDIFIVIVSMLFACLLQYGSSFMLYKDSSFVFPVVFAVLSNVCFFHLFHTYVGVIRFSSFIDILRILLSLTLGYGFLILCNLCCSVVGHGSVLPNTLLFMAYLFTFFLMVCMRIAVKMLYEAVVFDVRKCANVFIYGFHGTGVGIAKSLRINRSNYYRLCGFISDEPAMIGKRVMGCRIYPNDEFLFERLKEKDVRTVIVAPNKIAELEGNGMLDEFCSRNIHVLTIPPLSDCVDDGLIKEYQSGERNRKKPKSIDAQGITACVEGRRVMVTGAAGIVGREIVRQLAVHNPCQLILVDQAESPLYNVQLELADHWKNLDVRVLVADVANFTRMEAIFRETRPQLVFHAAAYKHLQLMEDYVSEAIQTNVLGTVNITDLSVKYNVSRMVMISTDRAHNPENSMEYSKRMAEVYVQSYSRNLWRENKNNTGLLVVRFGDVCPESYYNPMTLSGACMFVLEAGVVGEAGEIYLLDKTSNEVSKLDAPFVSEYARVRRCVSELIECSYTEDTSVLATEIKRVVQKLANADGRFMQPYRIDVSQSSYIKKI